jgi:hypothetical protein
MGDLYFADFLMVPHGEDQGVADANQCGGNREDQVDSG